MNKKFILKLIICVFTTGVVFRQIIPREVRSLEYEEIFSLRNNKSRDSQHKTFSPIAAPFDNEIIASDPKKILAAAEESLLYLRSQKGMDECDYIIRNNYPELKKDDSFSVKNLFTKRAEKTLSFIASSIKKDLSKNKPCRILQPSFLNQHFSFLRWQPDVTGAEKNKVELAEKNQIRTTKYAVFKTIGSDTKTDEYSCALYGFADESKADDIRFKFTKQDVVAGALEKEPYQSSVQPLIWVTRNGLEEALLQGTIAVQMPDKTRKFFTVDKNNGITYDRRIKDTKLQRRYWYFKEVSSNHDDASRSYVIKHGDVVVAGDLYAIGLGKLIAMRYENPVTKKREIRFGILADTGGAFTNNLYQLDLFAGIFNTREELFEKTRHFPQQAEAYILVKK